MLTVYELLWMLCLERFWSQIAIAALMYGWRDCDEAADFYRFMEGEYWHCGIPNPRAYTFSTS